MIQSHLKKLFAGINTVEFDADNRNISAMVSLDGEIVKLKPQVQVTTDVEGWLAKLASSMKSTLRDQLVQCVKSTEGLDPAKYPSQVTSEHDNSILIFQRICLLQILCLSEEIRFTEHCEKAIQEGKLNTVLSDLNAQLEAYTSAEPTTKVLELKLKALILDLIHHIEVIEYLIRENTKSIDSWQWQKQLRYKN